MKLTTFNEDAWGFAILTDPEVQLLENISSAADPAGCEESERRLYQPPMDDSAGVDESFTSDWEDFVTSEFREEFAAALSVVETDLENLEPLQAAESAEGEEPEGGELFSLRIPIEHAENWFSALNQARLVLAGRYGLFGEEGEEMISLSWQDDRPVVSVAPGNGTGHSPEARVDAYFKSQAFGFIQEWLVANVLSRGL